MSDPFPNEKPDPATKEQTGSQTDLKETLRETKDKIKAKSKEVAAQAKERGEEYAQQTKERAAARIGGVGQSVRQTAERFEREQDPSIAHYTRLLADKLEQAATYVRDRDLQQLRRDSEELARRHPTAFFGGMFVAGLAAARFFKASDRDHSLQPSEDLRESRGGGHDRRPSEFPETRTGHEEQGQGQPS